MLVDFFALPGIVQLHAGAALFALAIGPFVIWRRRRDVWHHTVGAIWICLMLTVATSAWFIHGLRLIGPFSPIHLFSLITYRSLFLALRHVRAGRFREHGAEMRSLYLQALCLTGILTLLPGRALHEIVFGDRTWLAIAIIAVLGVGLLAMFRRKPRLKILR